MALKTGETFQGKGRRRARRLNSLVVRAGEEVFCQFRGNSSDWKLRRSSSVEGERERLWKRDGRAKYTGQERSRGRLAGQPKSLPPGRSRKGWLPKIESPKSIIKGFSCGKPVQLKRQQDSDVYYFFGKLQDVKQSMSIKIKTCLDSDSQICLSDFLQKTSAAVQKAPSYLRVLTCQKLPSYVKHSWKWG